MKYKILYFLLLVGVINGLQAQDKIALRNGRAIDVKVHRSTATDIYYTYPGETSVYERPKSDISYILYSDGKREVFDERQRVTTTPPPSSQAPSRTTAPTTRSRIEDELFWQDITTTFVESDVKGMTRLQRVTAMSSVSYRDAIQQLKKKAADLGGTTILVMDIPENDDIEVIGVVYRDEKTEYIPRSANERNTIPAESSANVRRRQITQQMESYNNESSLIFEDSPSNTSAPSRTNTQQPARGNNQPRQPIANNAEPDAVYLTNGRVIKGVIEEFDPDDFVSIRTAAGRVYEFSIDDVKRVAPSTLSSNSRQSASARNSNAPSQRGNSRYDNNDRYSNNNRSSSSRNTNDFNDYGESGYKGIVDVGYNFALGKTGQKGNFEVNTSHGYQINQNFFAGAGLGLHMYSARDTAMKNPNKFPHYVGNTSGGKIIPTDSVTYMRAVDSSFMALPIFLDIRGYLPLQNSKLTPFFMFRFGYTFNLSDGFGGMGIYMNPAVGLKMQLTPMIGVNFSAGYAYQSYGGIPKDGGYGYYYINASNQKLEAKGVGGISLKLGVEF